MVVWWLALLGCGGPGTSGDAAGAGDTSHADHTLTMGATGLSTALLLTSGCSADPPSGDGADVEAVSASGTDGAYTVSVTVRSPDTGCEQYADWWELVTPEGELVARRILQHAHPDEQPFTRASEGPVAVRGDTELVARAHLHVDGDDPAEGYRGVMLQGTLNGGFREASVGDDFALDLATAAPLPEACWF